MPKQKAQSPQELYWARKQAQEAYLPPGLINHGNTCFMNSVLQGLIATYLLADLVQFKDIPEEIQRHSNTPLLSRRSPQLTNGHGRGGIYEKPWVDMPIGDKFIGIMYRAWSIQSQKRRESLSPKDLLAALGQKYDQYLDFAQQDAHEFLRILLDAMRMEEQDIIKQRQPPLPKQPKKRRRSSQPPPSSSTAQPQSMHHSYSMPNSNQSRSPSMQPQPLSESDTLISFSDMIFGGKLTSVLVCQKCKHISQTYEDFNDISLSLKAEDYAVSRKRDRLKNFAKKLAALPSSSLVAAANASNPSAHVNNSGGPSKGLVEDEREDGEEIGDGDPGKDAGGSGRMGAALQIQRSSSVPPSPREREDPQISEKLLPHLVSRRRSMEHLQSDLVVLSSNINSGSMSGPGFHADPLSDAVGGDAIPVAADSNGVVVAMEGRAGDSPTPAQEHVRAAETKEMESDGSNVIINGAALSHSSSPEEKHVEFVSADKPPKDHTKDKPSKDKEKKKRDTEDGWAKLGRRISLTVGIGRREKGKDKDKDKDKDKRRSLSADRRVSPSSSGTKTSTAIDPPDPAPSSNSNEIPSVSDLGVSSVSPLSAGTSITISVSSPDMVSLPASISGDPSHSNPPIATPTPVRSLSSQPYALPRLGTPLQSIQTHMQTINTHVQAQVQKVSGVQRSKSPKPPKQTKEEQEYLRRILADVGPAPVRVTTNAGDKEAAGSDGEKSGGGGKSFTKLKPTSSNSHRLGSSKSQGSQGDHGTKAENGRVGSWLPLAAMSQFSGLEECLRMFTAVEVLDGENMVGCRRCWKIQNGLVKGDKDAEDSEDEEDEAKESEGEEERENEKLLAPPLQSFNSESSTSSVSTYSSALSSAEDDPVSEELGGRRPGSNGNGVVAPNSPSAPTPTLTPSSTTFISDVNTPSAETPRPPHRSSSGTGVEGWSETTLATPKIPPPSLPLQPELHSYRMSQRPSPLASPPGLRRTPGGLPIPRISTTPAADSSGVEGVIAGAGVEDIFADTYGDPLDEGDGNDTPISESSSRSSVLLDIEEEQQGTTDEEVKKRRGMIFSDSLVVPQRKPGRAGRPKPTRRGTASTDEWVNSEAESGATSTSISPDDGSDSGSEESQSQDESEEYASEAGDTGPAVPPGLGHENPASPPILGTPAKVSTFPPSPTPTPGSESTPAVKSASRPKKKKETLLRPAYKRYLVSVPPPVLVIHLKRFQQLSSSSSSGLASFAERLAAGFSPPHSSGGGRSTSSSGGFGGGFAGFGGIGGGGFKKLEDFVSFPEWLDLSPFLAPKKESVVLAKKSKSKLKKKGRSKDVEESMGWNAEDERCMYRLYAVVVHIGNMLGGHYVAYVALPSEPPLSEEKEKVEEVSGLSGSPDSRDREKDDEVATNTKRAAMSGQRPSKRQWAYVSDTNVRLTSLEEVMRARAYICMYERV